MNYNGTDRGRSKTQPGAGRTALRNICSVCREPTGGRTGKTGKPD